MLHFIDIQKGDRGAQKHDTKTGQYVAVGASVGGKSEDDLRSMARDRGLRIPPNWKDIQLSKDAKSGLQATGVDKKGRKVYLYSVEHSQKASAEKFSRLVDFAKNYKNIESKIESDFGKSEEAQVLYLISKTAFRIGSTKDTKAEKKAYGATTLESQHVKINGSDINFSFTAKKGVEVNQSIKDSKLANLLKGKKGKIFDTNGKKVNDYLDKIAGDRFKVKDFRTHIGTQIAIDTIKSLPAPKNQSERKKTVSKVYKTVAEKLNNTPDVAKKSYVAPEVLDLIKIKETK